jgi:hypothetical protein
VGFSLFAISQKLMHILMVMEMQKNISVTFLETRSHIINV